MRYCLKETFRSWQRTS